MSGPSTEAHDRLTTLEVHFMEQQHALEQLSQVLVDQQRELDTLRAEVRALHRLLSRAAEGADDAGPLPHERPPHY